MGGGREAVLKVLVEAYTPSVTKGRTSQGARKVPTIGTRTVGTVSQDTGTGVGVGFKVARYMGKEGGVGILLCTFACVCVCGTRDPGSL